MSRAGALAAATALIFGCEELGYRVVLVPDEEVDLEGGVWELAILRGQCTPDLVDGDPPPADDLVNLLWWRSDAAGPAIGELEPGEYAFYARLRDADCVVRGAGCASVMARAGGEGRIDVRVLPVEGPACDDGDECTIEWCEEPDGCKSEVVDDDGDGVPCSEDCDDEDEDLGRDCGPPEDCESYDLVGGFERVFCTTPRSWLEALDTCEWMDGSLAVPRSYDELDATLLGAFDTIQSDWWIGANDLEQEGEWTDPSGNFLLFTTWDFDDPDGYEEENCAVLAIDVEYPGDWEDRNCEDRYPAICVVR